MIEYRLKQIEKEVPVKVVCNKSGKEVSLEDNDYIGENLMHSFRVNFHYGSNFHMDEWKFDLDEESLMEIVKTFKVRPSGFADRARYPDKVFEEWKVTGKYNWQAGWSEEEIREHDEKSKLSMEETKKL